MLKNKKNILIITLLISITLLFLVKDHLGSKTNQAHDDLHYGVNVGDMAPNFVLEDLEGKLVKLEDYHGKVVLLNFWSLG